MSTYDPRTLIRAFAVLQDELNRLNQTSGDTLKQSEFTQACAQERVLQALRWSAIASNQVKADLEDVEEIEAEVNGVLSQCDTAVDTAHETVAAIEQAKQQADATLNHWQAELQLALAWQARAEERLARAIQVFQQAERAYESAKRDLSSAESSLERCAKDPERKSCDGEQRKYNNARESVLYAIDALKVAEIEVKAAQEELEEAKERVRCCRAAVSYAEQAVQHSHTAKEQAEQALNDAERSLENAESANRAANNAQTKSMESEEYIEQLLVKVNQAERITNEAQVHTQNARSMSDSAYSLAVKGSQELAYRTDCLVRLNQTSFDSISNKKGTPNSEFEQIPNISNSSAADKSFAKKLNYHDAYDHLKDEGDYTSVKIIAKDNNGQESGYIIAERTSPHQVKIKDTGVPKQLRHRGIASELLNHLEEKLPAGTELWFEENQAPEFWQQKKFQRRINSDGKINFFKII